MMFMVDHIPDMSIIHTLKIGVMLIANQEGLLDIDIIGDGIEAEGINSFLL